MNSPRWRHDMETLSSLLAPCEGNPLVTGGFPSQIAANADPWCLFEVRLNQVLNKYSIGRRSEMPWRTGDSTLMVRQCFLENPSRKISAWESIFKHESYSYVWRVSMTERVLVLYVLPIQVWFEVSGRFRFHLVCIGAARGLVWLSLGGVWICIVSAMLLPTWRSGTSGHRIHTCQVSDKT